MAECGTDLTVVGLGEGEELMSCVRIITTLVSITVTSAWFSWRKIKTLSLFFSHWLAGLVAGLGYFAEDVMVSLCWTGSNLEGLIKALKFIELSAFNMFAVTNLAICINLALIVSSHRTMTRVKSVSSPPLLLMFLVISMALAVPLLALAERTLVSGTSFYVLNDDVKGNDFIQIAFFYVEFFVGACMFFIVAWLLLFRLKEVKECWKLHSRIRFYFVLTLVGTAANLGIGICGTVNTVSDDFLIWVIVWSWVFRYIHVGLDTVVLYGVLRERNIDERADGDVSGNRSGEGVPTVPAGRRAPQRGMPRRSGGSSDTSKPATFNDTKPVAVTPLV